MPSFFRGGPSVLGNPFQVFRERQLFKHDDRLHDMVVNFKPFFRRQGATRNAQVVNFAQIEFKFRHIELETVWVVCGRGLSLFAVKM